MTINEYEISFVGMDQNEHHDTKRIPHIAEYVTYLEEHGAQMIAVYLDGIQIHPIYEVEDSEDL